MQANGKFDYKLTEHLNGHQVLLDTSALHIPVPDNNYSSDLIAQNEGYTEYLLRVIRENPRIRITLGVRNEIRRLTDAYRHQPEIANGFRAFLDSLEERRLDPPQHLIDSMRKPRGLNDEIRVYPTSENDRDLIFLALAIAEETYLASSGVAVVSNDGALLRTMLHVSDRTEVPVECITLLDPEKLYREFRRWRHLEGYCRACRKKDRLERSHDTHHEALQITRRGY
ncbi:MAG: hypothetical protein HYW25_03715 [Candidatus Aenigmarchaeota archaeon]|nr:hypothetical protein [Candidatus Aenigmarchaeota archaeon]